MQSHLRILSIEDSEPDFLLVQGHLERSDLDFELRRVETEQALRSVLKEYLPDIILSDYSLPTFDGMGALLVAKELVPFTPFILVTGSVNEQTAVECLKAGADDYVLKDHLRRLPIAIQEAIERRRRARELRESEERLRLALQSANQGLYDLNVQTGEAIVSPEYALMLEYDPQEFVETVASWKKRLHPDDRERASRHFEEYLAGMWDDYKVEFRLKTKTGGWKWILSMGRIVSKDKDGLPLRMLGIHTDITDRKETECSLRESEETFRRLFISHPQPLWIYDVETLRFLAVNDATVDKYGYTREELLGMTIKDIRPPGEIPRLLEEVSKPVDGFDRSGFWKHCLRDGRIIEVEITTHVLSFGGRKAKLVMAYDVTDRVRAEGDLLRINRLYAVLSNINQMIVRVQEPQELFNEACRIAVEEGGFAMAWVGLLNGASATVDVVAFAGRTNGYLEHLQITLADTPRGRGPTATALRAGHHAISNDIEHNPTMAPWRDHALRLGFRSSGAFPLTVRGEVKGVLNFYSADPGFFDTAEIKLLDELALDVSFGMELAEREREREAVGKRLRESEERYRLLFSQMLDGFAYHEIILDEQGVPMDYRFLEVNSSFERITGLRGPDIVGKTALQVLPSLEPHWIQKYGEAVLTGNPVHFEDYAEPLDKYFEVTAFRTQPGRFATIFSDITDRKRSKQLLERYQLLSENARDIIFFIKYPGGTIVEANEAAVRHYGYSRDELLALNISDLRTLSEVPSLQKQMENAFHEGVFFETMHVKKNGTAFPVEVSSRGTRVGGEQMLLSIVHDISERKEAEERMVRLSRAVEQTDDAIMMTDQGGNILYTNPAFQRLYGYEEEEVLGQNPRLLKSGLMPEGYFASFWKKILAGEHVGAEHINRTKSGSTVFVATSVSPLLSVSGQITGFVAVQKDITAFKKAEEERRTLEQQLMQAQRLDSIGTLASGIAHDFNNILGIILGYLSLIERSHEDKDALKAHMQVVERAIQRGAGLVRQILTFARKTDVNLAPVDINVEIEDLMKLLNETFPKTITVVKELGRGLPVVLMDRTQLHQGLLNLCLNARDAMESSGKLTLETARVSGREIVARFPAAADTEYVRLRVTDTGTGMTREVQSRIFDPFFTTKEKGKGTGLGLAVVFGIVEAHKGFIDVDSKPGAGTCFSLYIPITMDVLAPDKAPTAVNLSLYGGHETILIVEDEEPLREMLVATLQGIGYRVLQAGDGMTALELYERQSKEIDLVISDLGLPKLDGLEALSAMKKITPSLRTILVSGYVEPRERHRITSEKIRAFVQKPYTPLDILSATRKVLDGH
ncbi:MAG: PAS domain S-box protein [Ignavibacteriales bacterium]|nr:PAS domain S-box protein [Ignavibacteriales bacterium]